MSNHLSPSPILQFNVGGLPASGYQLFTYAAGTTTKVTTYRNQSGSSSNTNPIILDSNGMCQIWLVDGNTYKYYLTTPTDTDPPSLASIFETDNIASPSSSVPGYSIHAISTDLTVDTTYNNAVILVNATAAGRTLTLPSAVTAGAGFILTIKKTDSSSNSVTLQTVLSQTIDGTTTKTITVQYHVRQIISDGSNWQVVIRPIAPTTATYLLQTASTDLPGAQVMGGLATGFVQNTTTTGVQQTRVITGTANEITLTNGNGVSGDPTVSIPSAVTLTGKTLTGGTFSAPTLVTPDIGGATGTSLNLSGLTISSAVATDASKNLVSVTNTGSGNNVLAASPNLTTPVLGTPTSGNLTNCTGLPVQGGGTGLATTTAYGVIHGGITATGNFQNSGTPGASGTIYRSGGASALPAWTTATYPTTAGTSGKVLISDGTNIVSSAPTFPNASATAGKFIRSDGTNWLAGNTTIPDTFAAGDIIYASASNVLTALAKDTNASRYLSNQGASNIPAWNQINLANGVTGTLPVANGGTAVTAAPKFRAYRTTGQSIASVSFVKVQLNNETYDTNSNFDSATNYRFTPTVAGYYQINACAAFTFGVGDVAVVFAVLIYLNGAAIAESINYCPAASDTPGASITDIINCNGSTDYIEMFVYNGSASARNVGGVGAAPSATCYMSGALLAP